MQKIKAWPSVAGYSGEKVDDDYGWQVVEWCRQNKGIAVKLINFQITVGSE